MIMSILIVACAPEDKRFKAKSNKVTKEINYSKKNADKSKSVIKSAKNKTKSKAKKSAKTQNKKQAKNQARLDRTTLKRKVNPSGLINSSIIINLEKIEVSQADQSLQDLNLKATVNLVDKSAGIGLELAVIDLEKTNANTDEITINKEIQIKKDELNKRITDIKSLNEKAILKLEINLIKKSEENSEDDNTCSILSTIEVDLNDIKEEKRVLVSQTRPCTSENDSDKNILMTLSVFSEGEYTITSGIVKNKDLVCQIAADENREDVIINLNAKKLTEYLIDEKLQITKKEQTEILAVSNFIDKKKKVETILYSEKRNKTKSVQFYINNDSCQLNNNSITQFTHSALIDVIDGKETSYLSGCCIEKDKFPIDLK